MCIEFISAVRTAEQCIELSKLVHRPYTRVHTAQDQRFLRPKDVDHQTCRRHHGRAWENILNISSRFFSDERLHFTVLLEILEVEYIHGTDFVVHSRNGQIY